MAPRALATRTLAWLVAAVVAAGALPGANVPFFSAPVAVAQESGKKKPRRIPPIQEAAHRRLAKAQELIDTDMYQDAMQILQTMADRPRGYNGAERAVVHQMLAYAYYELDNIEKTIEHYEQVLAQMPDISEGMELTTLNQLSKLYFQEGQKFDDDRQALPWYQKALTTMREWLAKSEDEGPDAHFYVAQIYYQMKDFNAAIEELELVVRLSRERDIRVREEWWTLLQYLYFDQENWPKVVEILEILVDEYPKRAYWVNLASVYGEMDQADKQLWTMEAAHAGGFLDMETDIRTFGGLLLQNELPHRASTYLKKGFDDEVVERTVSNLQTLGQAYQLAQEVDKAIPILEEAGEMAEDGRTYDLLSSLYLENDEHDKCIRAANNALEKGDIRNPLATRVTLGTCLFNVHNLGDARKVFVDVRRDARRADDRTEERIASQWVTYIDTERRRLAELERASL